MIIFDFSDAAYIDDTVALVMEQLIDVAAEEDTSCIVTSLSEPVAGVLHALNVFQRVPKDHFVDSLDEAKGVARCLLDNRDRSQAPR